MASTWPAGASAQVSARSRTSIGWCRSRTALAWATSLAGRALYLANECRDTFGRLVSGAIALTFFVYVFVNTGMVTGILPVVGVPLPLVSYGGTSMVTLMAGFGILMSLRSQRKLVRT